MIRLSNNIKLYSHDPADILFVRLTVHTILFNKFTIGNSRWQCHRALFYALGHKKLNTSLYRFATNSRGALLQ